MANRRLITALRIGALLLIGFGVLEVALLEVRSWLPMAVRAAWAATALTTAWGLALAGTLRRTVLLSLLAGTSPVFYAALVWDRGGVSGVAFACFFAIPLAVAAVLRGEVVPAIVCAVANLGAGLTLLGAAGHSIMEVGEWALAMIGGGALAVYTAELHRRMGAAQEEATADRLGALERLAQSEAKRTRAERSTLVGELAGGLAHEVNNPLAFMNANLQFLEKAAAAHQKSGAVDAEFTEMLRETAEGARRIAGVMSKLKALAFEPAEAAGGSLPETVKIALSSLKAPAGVQLHNEVPDDLPAVAAAPTHMRRVVAQVVFSALDSFDGGEAGKGNIWVRAREQDGSVFLSIEDDGRLLWSASSGGPADGVANRFRGPSSSMGLTLVRESVTRWGGKLRMGPRQGGGTRVELTFALASARGSLPPSNAVGETGAQA